MILFLHNRYRTTGGEERVVDGLLALVRERLGEPAELLTRDSAGLSRPRAALGLLRGGLAPRDVADAVRLTGARVVHAHNLNPAFGWRALEAAKQAGARVVLHLHQYRLVCANGVCFTHGADCTRCHGRNTLPGVVLGCRGVRSEGLAYGASLALWQRRVAQLANAVVVPSAFARERLRELGAPLDWGRVHVLAPPIDMPAPDGSRLDGEYALVASRLAPEKGIDVAIDACRLAGVPLVIAGDGPERDALRARASAATNATPGSDAIPGAGATPGSDAIPGADVIPGADTIRFAGHVSTHELARLRAGAALALIPSRSAETFGMAAAEAMAAGIPVVASRVGALPELVEEDGLVAAGDPVALAGVIERRWNDRHAGERGRERVSELCAPPAVAQRLERIYEAACAGA
jgi:glycosyltransferase involved in cell wall biosynthesis